MIEQKSPQRPFSPLLAGTLIGLCLMTLILPGGYDAGNYYLLDWGPRATAPGWVFLITQPVGRLPWPLDWLLLTAATVLAVRFATQVWGVQRWWVTMFSMPMLWNLWLGQIELFSIVGAALALLVLQKRLRAEWFGLALLALATKPQTGAGMLLLFCWWLWREQGVKPLLRGALVAGAVVLVTLLLWPGWPGYWLESLRRLNPGSLYFSATIFPFGLAALPVALLPLPMERRRRVRMMAAATLLASPYFANYHISTLLTLHDHPAALLVSWLALLPLFAAEDWMKFSWIVPLLLLLADAALAWRAAQR